LGARRKKEGVVGDDEVDAETAEEEESKNEGVLEEVVEVWAWVGDETTASREREAVGRVLRVSESIRCGGGRDRKCAGGRFELEGLACTVVDADGDMDAAGEGMSSRKAWTREAKLEEDGAELETAAVDAACAPVGSL
jgi:hypothetical protein